MEKMLTFDELEGIIGGADISSGLGLIITGSGVAGAGVKTVYTAATATKTLTIIGMSCPTALFVAGGVALIIGGVGLAAYGVSLLDD